MEAVAQTDGTGEKDTVYVWIGWSKGRLHTSTSDRWRRCAPKPTVTLGIRLEPAISGLRTRQKTTSRSCFCRPRSVFTSTIMPSWKSLVSITSTSQSTDRAAEIHGDALIWPTIIEPNIKPYVFKALNMLKAPWQWTPFHSNDWSSPRVHNYRSACVIEEDYAASCCLHGFHEWWSRLWGMCWPIADRNRYLANCLPVLR